MPILDVPHFDLGVNYWHRD